MNVKNLREVLKNLPDDTYIVLLWEEHSKKLHINTQVY